MYQANKRNTCEIMDTSGFMEGKNDEYMIANFFFFNYARSRRWMRKKNMDRKMKKKKNRVAEIHAVNADEANLDN